MAEVKSLDEVMQRFREITFHETFDMIVAIANGGIIPAAIINQRLNTEIQLAVYLLQGARQIKTFAVKGKADYSLYDEACFRFPGII